MLRRYLLLQLGWLVLALLSGAEAFAQEALAPQEPLQPPVWPYQAVDPDYFRGPGFYLSVGKIGACWLLFLAWVKTTDWVNQDLQIHHLKIRLWNPIVVGSFAAAFMLVWVIPAFAFGFFLMLVAYVAPLATYIFYYRNPQVDEQDRVLTPDHLRFWAAEQLKFIGIKIESEKPEVYEKGPELQLTARGAATDQDNQANLILARQMPGYTSARQLLSDALAHRASAALLSYGETVGIRYLIDGVWHNYHPQPREAGDQVLEVLKTVSAIDPQAAAAKQSGYFGVETEAGDLTANLTCQIADGDQRALISLPQPAAQFETLEDLGMRAKTAEQLRVSMSADNGFLLFSALPAGGLTTTLDVALTQVDRFMRDVVSIEEKHKPPIEIDSIDLRTYDASAGESPATILPTVGRTQPNVIVCRDLVNADSVKELCKQSEERLIIGTIAAKDSVEALLRILVMKVPPAVFAAAATGVLHVRLIRKLCEDCRQAYEPTPALLQRLGIPVGKVQHLYRPPKGEAAGACPSCDGIGYRGRTGIFEFLVVDDNIRKMLVSKPQLDTLRKAARQAGLQTEREHGILLAARGVISLEELQRVLKS